MATTVSGQVGYAGPAGNTSQQGPLAQGRNFEAIVTELHGKYYEINRRGTLFMASQALAGVVLTQLTTTPSNALANPPGANKGLSLVRVEIAIKALPATPVVGYYVLGAAPSASLTAVTGTALVAASGQIGSLTTPVGKAFTSPTLPGTPVQQRLLAQKLTGAATVMPYLAILATDFDGSLIIQPGGYVCVAQDATDSTNATAAVTYIWEEVDL